MKKVTAQEFRAHLSDYFRILEKEDIAISRHKEIVGVLVHPSRLGEGTSSKWEACREITVDYFERMLKLLKEE